MFWEEKTNDGEAFEGQTRHYYSWRQTRRVLPPLSTWTDASVCAWVKEKRAASLQGLSCCIYKETTMLADDGSSPRLQSRRPVQSRKLRTEGKSFGGGWLSAKVVMINSFYDKYEKDGAFTETPLQNSLLLRRLMCFFSPCFFNVF